VDDWEDLDPNEIPAPAFEDPPDEPKPDRTNGSGREPGEDDGEQLPGRLIPFKQLDAFTVRPVNWLWPKRVPRGKVTIVEGDPGVGKSSMVVDLVARMSTGRPWPDEGDEIQEERTPHRVLWMTLEDDPSETILPRVIAAQGDPAYINICTMIPMLARRDGPCRDSELAIERTVLESNSDILVLDPGSAAVEDGNSEPIVRQAMGVLYRLGLDHGLTTIWIRHLAKARADREPMMAGIGSIGVSAAARSVLQLIPDHQRRLDCSPWDRVLIHVKNNLGPLEPPIRYGLEFVEVENIECVAVRWGQVEDEMDALEILRSNQKALKDGKRRTGAIEEALLEAFQRKNPLTSKQVLGVYRRNGLPSARTVTKWTGWKTFTAEFQVERNGQEYRMQRAVQDDEEPKTLFP